MLFDYQGIIGIDLSTYQDSPLIPGNVNFQLASDYGMRFAIIKAGQGNWMDPDFLTNWHNVRGILPRNSYFFYDNHYDPKVQAQKYVSILEIEPVGHCWVDLEDRSTGDFGTWRKWYDFLEEFKAKSDLPIGIYTGLYYWQEYTRFCTAAQLDYFKQYPLWLATYPVSPFSPPFKDMICPKPWPECLILQSGTPVIGLQVGMESKEVDYDIFNGGEEKFNTYFPVERIKDMHQGTVKAPSGTIAKLWDKVGGTMIKELKNDLVVKGDPPSGEYIHLVSPYVGWTKKIWVPDYHLITEPVTPLPPPPPVPTKKLTYTVRIYNDGSIESIPAA
jgi:hypothetical protein